MMHFFIHNSFHSGDIILTRPFITVLIEKYPDLTITLECRDYNVYLWEDFGFPIKIYTGNDHLTAVPTPNCPPDSVFLNMWFCVYGDLVDQFHLTYKTNVLTFNRYMEYYHLNDFYQLSIPEAPPAVKFYRKLGLPFAVNEAGILIENGPVRSAQSNFPMNDYVESIAKAFPQFTFYCSAKPPGNAPNLVDCSHLNLIQLSGISNHCKALITHGSGVEASTYTEENRFKPRCMVGMGNYWIIWDNSQVFYAQGINGIVEFLGKLPDGKWFRIKRLLSKCSKCEK
jgi:hypothetical protein